LIDVHAGARFRSVSRCIFGRNDNAVREAPMKSLSIKLALSVAGLAILLAVPANAVERKYRAQAKPKPAATSTWYGVRTYPPNTVTFSTYVLGTDPDPHIRQGMRQDIGAKFGGGPD
jgi:hypothetical protein